MKKQKSQKGIVLLSCLVFLLILTSLVKYTMSSAKMEELKAGADFDEMSAKEAALLAIKDAEDFILRRYYDSNGNKYRLLTDNKPSPTSNEYTVRLDGEYATGFWENPQNWKYDTTGNKTKHVAGVYDGDDPDDRCNDETCLKMDVYNEWYKKTEKCNDNETTSVICYGRYTRAKKVIDPERAKYIIEVFRPNPAGLTGVFAQTLAADEDGGNTIVLRVTAVGYSQNPKDGLDFKKGSVPNDTYAMYQATYILSSE